ncbi:MAG: hypothetical protein ABII82_17450, partial [Verrucomicrobiota bacterium]
MRILDDVRRDLRKEDYDDAMASFLRICRECGVEDSAVGFFGNIGEPGISDIDAVVVGTGEVLSHLSLRHQEERRRSVLFAYVFWHDPLWLLEDAQKWCARLHTLENLRWVAADCARTWTMEQGGGSVLRVAWFIYLMGIHRSWLRKVRSGSSLGLRQLLLLHKNLHHSIEFFGDGSPLEMADMLTPVPLRQRVMRGGWDSRSDGGGALV